MSVRRDNAPTEALSCAEADLEAFERLVLTQQPAAKAWEPVTDYSFEARKAIEGKHPELIRDVFQPKRVCDAGMGPGHLVHLLRDLGVNAYGFDVSRGGTCYGDLTQPYLGDPANFPWLSRSRNDLVICREVLEHLTIRQIRQAVMNLCALSSRFVYVTTRLNTEATHMLDVKTSDDLDPTHITMMSPTLLRTLFVLEGFRRRADLEDRLDWMKKKRVFVYERV